MTATSPPVLPPLADHKHRFRPLVGGACNSSPVATGSFWA